MCDLSQGDLIATYPWDPAKMFPGNKVVSKQPLLERGAVFQVPSQGSFLQPLSELGPDSFQHLSGAYSAISQVFNHSPGASKPTKVISG